VPWGSDVDRFRVASRLRTRWIPALVSIKTEYPLGASPVSHMASLLRFSTAVLQEHHDEWQDRRSHLSMQSMALLHSAHQERLTNLWVPETPSVSSTHELRRTPGPRKRSHEPQGQSPDSATRHEPTAGSRTTYTSGRDDLRQVGDQPRDLRRCPDRLW